MLKVASFPITDADGINNLLKDHRLASGAHILVSDGQVCIPYEDGEPDTKVQRIVAMKESQVILRRQIDEIEHSQRVLDRLIADAQERLKFAQAQRGNNRSNKELEKKESIAQGNLDNLLNQRDVTNAQELIRLHMNIELYDEKIAELTNG